LYTSDAVTIEKIFEIFPECVSSAGVDRNLLSNKLQKNNSLFSEIENIVHPAIREHRLAFIEACNESKQKLAVVDIPLLFETNANDWLDAVLVVTTDQENQRKRVMSRSGMNEKIFNMISERQMPDHEKKKKADYIIETKSIAHVQFEVQNLIKKLIGSI